MGRAGTNFRRAGPMAEAQLCHSLVWTLSASAVGTLFLCTETSTLRNRGGRAGRMIHKKCSRLGISEHLTCVKLFVM